MLPDPTPPGAGPGQWWPPVMWDADWVRANADSFDVMHVHFGMESFAPAHMRGVLQALAEVGRPFVLTVHDLQNPQLVDQAAHLAQLDLLIGAADAVATLTAGAAAEIADRWGRNAVVIPHPRMLDRADRFAALAPAERPRIGIHLKDLRPGVDGPGTVAAASEALRLRAGHGAVLEIHLHQRVRDHDAERRVRALAESDPAIELQVHSRLDDDELAASIARLSAAILPYRHGTHSGWLELCWDLGVPVLAPTIGHLNDQHADGVFAFDRDPHSMADSMARSMARAMDRALAPAPDRNDTIRRRSTQRDLEQSSITDAHRRLYRAVIDTRGEGGHVSDTAAARSTPVRTPH